MERQYDFLPEDERPYVARAFDALDTGNEEAAEHFFLTGLEGSFSDDAKALFHYGMGLIHYVRGRLAKEYDPPDFDDAIRHLEACLEVDSPARPAEPAGSDERTSAEDPSASASR